MSSENVASKAVILEEQLASRCDELVTQAVKMHTNNFDTQVYLAGEEFDLVARKAVTEVREQAAQGLNEAKKEIAGLRQHVEELRASLRREERREERPMVIEEDYTPRPLSLADDLGNLPGEDEPVPLALTYCGRTIAGPERVALALKCARRLGHIPESVYQDPLDSLENELSKLTLKNGDQTVQEKPVEARSVTPGNSRRRRRRRTRKPARDNQGRIAKRPRPGRVEIELRQANADLIRIRAEREQLRLELLALKTHCRATGVGEPRIPLPPGSRLGYGKIHFLHFVDPWRQSGGQYVV